MLMSSRTLSWLSAGMLFVAPILAHAEDIEREFAVDPGGLLFIDSDAGAIEINTWDENRVRLLIRNVDSFDVEVEQRSDGIYVVAESQRRLFNFGSSNLSFRVDVPRQFNLDLDTGGGRIDVGDLTGSVRADTSGGSISIGRITQGNVLVDTSGGRITILDVEGNVEADTSGGNIDIGNVTGNVLADTSGGRITIGDVGGNISADTSGGSIDVGTSGGRVLLDTSGGTIRAAWAQGPIEADTSGGNIYLDGSATSVKADTSGGNIVIEASDGPVQADTSGGNITIRRSRAAIEADTSGGRIDAELLVVSPGTNASITLESSGGDITLRLPASHAATVNAELSLSRRGFGSHSIFTDFPLSIQEEDDYIIARGDINGGGDPVRLRTSNSDIHIIRVDE
ncbi:MAG: hypothetical protein RQ757_01815 [Pseudomonadales bacterium]|nr:hypothetical protein [Pseudomonadales bacterium]